MRKRGRKGENNREGAGERGRGFSKVKYCLKGAFTFWVDGVAMEIPIPDPGNTDSTLYCRKGNIYI